MFRAFLFEYHKNRYAEIARRKDGVYFYRTQRIGGGEQMSSWEEMIIHLMLIKRSNYLLENNWNTFAIIKKPA